MSHEDLLARITVDPAVAHGKPCIRGQRVWVSLILGMLEGGMTNHEILEQYPSLDRDDILACLAYANELAGGRFLELTDRDVEARPRAATP